MKMREAWILERDANRAATDVDGILKKIERVYDSKCKEEMEMMSMTELVSTRRTMFMKQIELYENMRLDLEGVLIRVNDETMFYSDVKKYVYSTYNIMSYPRICAQLYEERAMVSSGRESVLELLIENLSEKFAMYKSDTFDNIWMVWVRRKKKKTKKKKITFLKKNFENEKVFFRNEFWKRICESNFFLWKSISN